MVTDRVVRQLENLGAVSGGDLSIEYWLIAGHIAPGSAAALEEWFDQREGWVLKDRAWIAERLQALCGADYEDDIVTMAMKLSEQPVQP